MEFKCKYWTELDMQNFGKVLSNKSNSHKLYFFSVIIEAISKREKDITFSEIAERMIALAWYPVIEHHVHLGQFISGIPKDTIEQAVIYINNLIDIKASANSETLIKKIREIEKTDEKVTWYKNAVLKYAPTRLLSPFLDAKESDFQREDRIYELITQTNETNPLPYTLMKDAVFSNRKVIINPLWYQFVSDNYVEIVGWINNERLAYLQKRNPEMPGLVFKLAPYKRDRQLADVRQLWKCILKETSIRDIYSGEEIDAEDFHIDHFIPWSYVACDELWNLCPIIPKVNIAKSNKLAEERYVSRFVDMLLVMYKRVLVEKKRKLADVNYSSELLSIFEKCQEKHVWAVWASEELFIDDVDNFECVLKDNIIRVYNAAINQGYSIWNGNY